MEISNQRLLKTGLILFTFELMNFCLMRVSFSTDIIIDKISYLFLMINLLEFLWVYLLVSQNLGKSDYSKFVLLLSLLKVFYLIVYINFLLQIRNVVFYEAANIVYESLSAIYYYLALELLRLCPIEIDKNYSRCIKYSIWVKVLSQVVKFISYGIIIYHTDYIKGSYTFMRIFVLGLNGLSYVNPLVSIIICCVMISILRKVLKIYTFNKISWMDQTY